jgi:hypothetical protein
MPVLPWPGPRPSRRVCCCSAKRRRLPVPSGLSADLPGEERRCLREASHHHGAHGAYACSVLRPPRMGPFPRLRETAPLSWRVSIESNVDWLLLFVSAGTIRPGGEGGDFGTSRAATVGRSLKRSELTCPGSRPLPREPSQTNVGFRPRLPASTHRRHWRYIWEQIRQGLRVCPEMHPIHYRCRSVIRQTLLAGCDHALLAPSCA